MCYCDLSGSSKVKGHGAKQKIICIFLSMKNSNYYICQTATVDIGTFLSKNVNPHSGDQKCT